MVTKTYCPDLSGLNLIPPVLLYNLSQPRKAKITVTPYKSIIRYKYDNETWQTIEADDYEIDNDYVGKETLIPRYRVFLTAKVVGRYPDDLKKPVIFNDGDIVSLRSSGSSYGIIEDSIVFDIDGRKRLNFKSLNRTASSGSVLYKNTNCYIQDSISTVQSNEPKYRKSFLYNYRSTNTYAAITDVTISHVSQELNDTFPPLVCKTITSKCTFKVYKCGQLILQKERKNCPQIELFKCFLDYQNTQVISIDLIPFEGLYVATGITNIFEVFNIINLIKSALDGLPFSDDDLLINYLQNLLGGNEKECIIIFTHFPGSPINIIKQICSTCNCLPPQVIVECDPDEECPPNTCAVDCGDHICCYNSEGISIKSIKK